MILVKVGKNIVRNFLVDVNLEGVDKIGFYFLEFV